MAMGKGSGRKCQECGTEHATQRGDCLPLDQRRGPDVSDPNHPANTGATTRMLASIQAPYNVPFFVRAP